MSFAIVAEFPLGYYMGRIGSGQVDLLPSPARLHSALMAAAGSGLRATVDDGNALRVRAVDVMALQWLECNPPDGMALPSLHENVSRAQAYRNLGLAPKKKGLKRVLRNNTDGVAIGGRIMWVWREAPPQEIQEALDELCPDVAYLGQSDSPVRMWTVATATISTTHRRDLDAKISNSQDTDIDLDVPRPERTGLLLGSFDSLRRQKLPSIVRDGLKSDEKEIEIPSVGGGLGRERYTPVTSAESIHEEPLAPWSHCWIIPFVDRDDPQRVVEQEERVAACVALHRALVSRFNADAPAVLTGTQPKADVRGCPRPANHIALQIVDDSSALSDHARVDFDHRRTNGITSRQAFVVAVPRGTDQQDLRVLTQAVNGLRRVYAIRRTFDLVGQVSSPTHFMRADTFWNPPAEGLTRVWSVLPAIAETRNQGRKWALVDAAVLAAGLVWRDELLSHEDLALRGDRRYRLIVANARMRGIAAIDARPIFGTRINRYVHKTHKDLMPLLYTATMCLGSLNPTNTALVAVGQTRHLGGGLLVPCDVPLSVVDTWRMR